MKSSIASYVRRASSLYLALSTRERLLIGLTAIVALAIVFRSGVALINEHLGDTELEIASRERDYRDFTRYAGRYRLLNERLQRLKTSFNESQMTFEQVTSDLDQIVRRSVGSSDYDLRKSGNPEELGEDFEKQDFSLNIRSINLDQLVRLLYELQEGKSPLFLSKVDVTKLPRGAEFRATLEIATVGAR
ncbi:MAG: hypothetical protein KDD44_11860, partial [Bdellovibrionales bacterium]|nr:hypothetical protein [Bdellovibrionales bacterium]